MTYTAIGLETNIAARIESQATPGEVWVSASTREHASPEAEFAPRGQLRCKGISHPVDAFCAVSP